MLLRAHVRVALSSMAAVQLQLKARCTVPAAKAYKGVVLSSACIASKMRSPCSRTWLRLTDLERCTTNQSIRSNMAQASGRSRSYSWRSLGQLRVSCQMEALCIYTLFMGHPSHPEPAGGLQAGHQLHEEVGRPAGKHSLHMVSQHCTHQAVYAKL